MLYKISTEFEKYSTVKSAEKIISDLGNQASEITILDLSLNTYTPEVLKEMCSKIKEMKALRHVILESIFDSLNYEDMCLCLELLCESLPETLLSFELPSNAVSCNFPEKFGDFLSRTPLKKLNLHNCGLGEDGLVKVGQCLKKLEDKSILEYLDLSKNRINVISKEFAEVFSAFENLSSFKLQANTIEESSMELFLGNIENENLQLLDLSDNFVCGKAIDYLGEVFIRNKITELYLQDIKVDDGDIFRLLKKMNSKPTQEVPGGFEDQRSELILDISCNSFEQDCVKLLEDLASRFLIKKLVIFDNCYDSIDDLKTMISSDGGVLIDQEGDLMSQEEVLDDELIKRLGSI